MKNLNHKLFITGTDTNIGKTYISVGLLNAFRNKGYSTMGIKPVASGGFYDKNILYNQDSLDLLQASSIQLDYSAINPFVFEPPIAPHIAAERVGISLSLQEIILKLKYAFDYPCDIKIIEGVGGLAVPLNKNETMIDFVSHYKMPVVLVVGIRLGCINHAVLTAKVIQQKHLPIVGWIANCIEASLPETDAIIATIQHWLSMPYLGKVSYGEKPEHCLTLDNLFHEGNITR